MALSPYFCITHWKTNFADNQNPTFNSCSSSPYCFPRQGHNWNFVNYFGIKNIWTHRGLEAQAMSTTRGDPATPRSFLKSEDEPEHLLVLVHGILASPSDWTYFEAELKTRLGKKFLIHASSCNTYTKTFTGIDGAGKRLADEVMQIVQKTESLKKISFLAHSLGGLFARYALAVLYMSSDKPDAGKGLITGLEAINFITLATPHLGVRGNKQLPFLFGVPFLEKLAAPIAPILTGRTGSQLFLTDGKSNRPPLLLRMASDCEDGKFISALGAFRCRMLYANVSYDHMVGWRTSSIRREAELAKPPRRSLVGYKHVVDVVYCPPVLSDAPRFPPKAAKAKKAAQKEPSTKNTVEYHEIMEEEMIHGLQRVGWMKVDVSFHSAFWPFFAHNNIHVKNEWFHNAGAGVVAHVADTIKQQEAKRDSSFYFAAFETKKPHQNYSRKSIFTTPLHDTFSHITVQPVALLSLNMSPFVHSVISVVGVADSTPQSGTSPPHPPVTPETITTMTMQQMFQYFQQQNENDDATNVLDTEYRTTTSSPRTLQIRDYRVSWPYS